MEQVSGADKNKKENKIVIREFNKDRDNYEVLENLERNCEIAESDKEEDQVSLSMFTNMVSDPFHRIRFYALRVILVFISTLIIISISFLFSLAPCRFMHIHACIHTHTYILH